MRRRKRQMCIRDRDKKYECLNSIGDVPKMPPSDIFNTNNDKIIDDDLMDDDLIDYDDNQID